MSLPYISSLCFKCIHKDVCKNITEVNEDAVCPNLLQILFLCDKRADCKNPCYQDCHYTTDIRHAKNFERVEQYRDDTNVPVPDLNASYQMFKEIESHEDWLDPKKDGFNVLYECKPSEDKGADDKDEGMLPYYVSVCTNCGKDSPVGDYCIWCGQKGTCLESGDEK